MMIVQKGGNQREMTHWVFFVCPQYIFLAVPCAGVSRIGVLVTSFLSYPGESQKGVNNGGTESINR